MTMAFIRAILVQANKWPGVELEGSAPGLDLFAGVATSGLTGADVFTVPATGRIEILCVILSMRNCTGAATITIRAFTNVNGAEDQIYEETFVQGTDPDGIMVINGNFGASEPIRFEMASSAAGDVNVDVPYKAIWREME